MSIQTGYKRITSPEITAYPDLLVEHEIHTNGADRTYAELRHGKAGFLVCMRSDDSVNRQSEWFNYQAHGFWAEGAADDYAARGGIRADALAAAKTQTQDDLENSFRRVPSSELPGYPDLVCEEQTHTNGATTSFVEFRRGGAGYLVILRTVDWTSQEIEWHNGRAHGEDEYHAVEDYLARGGDRGVLNTALDRFRRYAAVISCSLCGLKKRETDLYAVNGGGQRVYGSLVELNNRDDGDSMPVAYQVVCGDCLKDQGALNLEAQVDVNSLRPERASIAILRAGADPERYWGFAIIPGQGSRAILHVQGQSNWGVVRVSLSGYAGATTDAALLDWLTRPAARPTDEYGPCPIPGFFDPATREGQYGLRRAARAAHDNEGSVSLSDLQPV
jgi:hypothetical protein